MRPQGHPASSAAAVTAPRVSVIVPVRNAAGPLGVLFAALRAQTVDRDAFEVIVVDDGSTDDTADFAEAGGLARVVRSVSQSGSYAARNVGIPYARADIFAFTDADCIPSPTWIENGLAALEDSRVDLVAGHIEVPVGADPSTATLLGLAKHHLDQEYHVSEQSYGATANLWVRRDVLTITGPFDGGIRSGGDSEFCRRAVAAGASLAYAATVIVTHPPRSTARDLMRKQLRIGFGAAQYRSRAAGARASMPRIWARPGAYVPRRTLRGIDVLHARGYSLTRRQRLAFRLTQYFCSQLPIAVGNLAGAIHQHLPTRAHLRRTVSRSAD